MKTKIFTFILLLVAATLQAAMPGVCVDFDPLRAKNSKIGSDAEVSASDKQEKINNIKSQAKSGFNSENKNAKIQAMNLDFDNTFTTPASAKVFSPVPNYLRSTNTNYDDPVVQAEIALYRQAMVASSSTPKDSDIQIFTLSMESATEEIVWTPTPSPDIDGSGWVDVDDLFRLSESWLAQSPNYNPECDINKDGIINIKDFAVLASFWQENVAAPGNVTAAPFKTNHENFSVNADLNGQGGFKTYFSQPGYAQVVKDIQEDSEFQYIYCQPGQMIEKQISGDVESLRYLIRPGAGMNIHIRSGDSIVAGLRFDYGVDDLKFDENYSFGRIYVYENDEWKVSDRTWGYSPHWRYVELKLDFESHTYKAYYVLEDTPLPISYYGPQGHTNVFNMPNYETVDRFRIYSGQDDWSEVDNLGVDNYGLAGIRPSFELTEPNPHGVSLHNVWSELFGLGGKYAGLTSNFVRVYLCPAEIAFMRNTKGDIVFGQDGPFFYWDRWQKYQIAEIHDVLEGDIFDQIDTSMMSAGLYCLAFVFHDQYNEIMVDSNGHWFWYINDYLQHDEQIVAECPTHFQIWPEKLTMPFNHEQELFQIRWAGHTLDLSMTFDSRDPRQLAFGEGAQLALSFDGSDTPMNLCEVFEGNMRSDFTDITGIPVALLKEYGKKGHKLFHPVTTDPVSDVVRYVQTHDPNEWPDPNEGSFGIERRTWHNGKYTSLAEYTKTSAEGFSVKYQGNRNIREASAGYTLQGIRNNAYLREIYDQHGRLQVVLMYEENLLKKIEAGHHSISVEYANDVHISSLTWLQNNRFKSKVNFVFEPGLGLRISKQAAKEDDTILTETVCPLISMSDPNFYSYQTTIWSNTNGKLSAIRDVNDLSAVPVKEILYDKSSLIGHWEYTDANSYAIQAYEYHNVVGDHLTVVHSGEVNNDAEPNLLRMEFIVQDGNGKPTENSTYVDNGLVRVTRFEYEEGSVYIPFKISEQVMIGSSVVSDNKFTTYDNYDRPLTIAEGEPNGIVQESIWHPLYESLLCQKTTWQFPGKKGFANVQRIVYGNPSDGSYNPNSPVPVVSLQLKNWSEDPNEWVWTGEQYSYENGQVCTKQIFMLKGNPSDAEIASWPKVIEELFVMNYDQHGYVSKISMDGETVYLAVNDSNGNVLLSGDHEGNVVRQYLNGFEKPYCTAKYFDPDAMNPEVSFNINRYTNFEPVSEWRKFHNDKGQVLAEKMPWGEIVEYDYNLRGDIKAERHYMNDVLISQRTIEYNGRGLVASEVTEDFNGGTAVITKEYDAVDKESNIAEYFNGNFVKGLAQSNCHFGPYDITTIGPDGKETRTLKSYNSKGELNLIVVDPNGLELKTRAEYDSFGNQVQVTEPAGNVTYMEYGPFGVEKTYFPVPDGTPKCEATVNSLVGYKAKGKPNMQATLNKNGSLASLKLINTDSLGRLKTVAQPNSVELMDSCYQLYYGSAVFDFNDLPVDPNMVVLSVEYVTLKENNKVFNQRITTAEGWNVLGLTQNSHYENVLYPSGVMEKQAHDPDDTLQKKVVMNELGQEETIAYETGEYGKPIEQQFPDGGKINPVFDIWKNLVAAFDQRVSGQTGNFAQKVDHHGNITLMQQGLFEGNFEYNSKGQFKRIQVKRSGELIYDVEYKFDKAQRLDEIYWFGRLVVQYVRDDNGNPLQLIYSFDGTLSDTMMVASTFDYDGNKSSFNLIGVPYAFGWNNIQRNGNGYVTSATETFLTDLRHISGEYDPIGRLKNWGWSGNNWSYELDRDGCMLSDGQSTFSHEGMLLSGRNDGSSLLWDGNGRLMTSSWMSNPAPNLAWDYEGQLVQAGNWQMWYNPVGLRTRMKNGSTDIGFFSDPGANDLITWDNSLGKLDKCIIYDLSGLPLVVVSNKLNFLIHGNNRNVRLVIDEYKQLDSYYTWDPYGCKVEGFMYSDEGSGVNPFGAFSYMRTPWQDYYVKARYYSPRLRCFYSFDSVWSALTNPQEVLPRNQYCRSNPVNLIDPTGQFSFVEILSVSGFRATLSGLQYVTLKGINTVVGAGIGASYGILYASIKTEAELTQLAYHGVSLSDELVEDIWKKNLRNGIVGGAITGGIFGAIHPAGAMGMLEPNWTLRMVLSSAIGGAVQGYFSGKDRIMDLEEFGTLEKMVYLQAMNRDFTNFLINN